MATGWLGWAPDLALDTPIPLIQLAVDGKVEFVVQTNPFGRKDGQKKPVAPDDPAEFKRALKASFEGLAKGMAGTEKKR